MKPIKEQKTILTIEDLHVSFMTHQGEVQAIRGIDLHIDEGEILCLVGESGSGKSVTANSILRLLPKPIGVIKSGRITYLDEDLQSKSESEMERIRGNAISMIFQDPMTALNPTMRVGKQLVRVILRHQKMTAERAQEHAAAMLTQVGISDVSRRMKQYPFELSGGLRQRVMIAMALSCNPELLLADEPTTALDVTIQAQILGILKKLKTETHTSILLITHDLGVVAKMADRVAVMYAGKIVEEAEALDLFEHPLHPYTWGLMDSIPDADTQPGERLTPIEGYPPDLMFPPAGCPFYRRCAHALKVCADHYPETFDPTSGHRVSCWLYHPYAPYHGTASIREAVMAHE